MSYLDAIAESIVRCEEERRLSHVGYINVSLELMGVLIHEAREACRFVCAETGVRDAPLKIRGWPVFDSVELNDMDWSIVPP